MKTTNFKSSEKKAVKNAMAAEMFSPFQVQSWINKHLDLRLENGCTIKELLVSKGFSGKKLQVRDLLQVETIGGMQTVLLKRYASTKNVSKDLYRYLEVSGKYPMILGTTCYLRIPAPFTVEAFLQSLSDKQKVEANRVELLDIYTNMFEKIASKESKANKKANKKANSARKRNLLKMIQALKTVEMYKNAPFITVARVVLRLGA